MRLRWLRGADAGGWIVALLALGCSSPTALGEAAPCSAAFDSCVLVTGHVVGERGQPLVGVWVGPRATSDEWGFSVMYNQTDSSGYFAVRFGNIYRMPAGAVGDSLPVWIKAAIQPQLPQMTATVFDSVLVKARISPLGEVPVPVVVSIRLAVP